MGLVSTNTQIPHHSARLIPSYRTTVYKSFCLEKDITILMEVLQNFGIDIFANHNFDTWVLFEIHARVINNSWSDPLATCVSPLFSLISKLTKNQTKKKGKIHPLTFFSPKITLASPISAGTRSKATRLSTWSQILTWTKTNKSLSSMTSSSTRSRSACGARGWRIGLMRIVSARGACEKSSRRKRRAREMVVVVVVVARENRFGIWGWWWSCRRMESKKGVLSRCEVVE